MDVAYPPDKQPKELAFFFRPACTWQLQTMEIQQQT